MKVALLGDVHANLPALEAVLAHARLQHVDALWNVGDFVGYGALPDQVVGRLRQENTLSIAGNYDLKALQFAEKKDRWRASKPLEKYLAFRWAYENLSAASREYLRSLPEEMRLEVEGRRILLVHGSPTSNTEHLTPDTPDHRLHELAHIAAADVVVCGHSHRPFVREVGGVWFINTGSVGRPDDGDPRACYAVLDLAPQALEVHHHRLQYDLARAVNAIRENGLPEAFARMILQGCDLDTALQAEEEEAEAFFDDDEGEDQRLDAVLRLAESCGYEVEHTHQVTRLALLLFDELEHLHNLGDEERFWLQCGALLHDIGWIEGQSKHHKTSLRIILNSPLLPFDERERLIIGSIARYHRKALPTANHDHFAALDWDERRTVSVLASFLRVADGLDRTHRSVVEDLACEVLPGQVVVRCYVRSPAEAERLVALEKGKLLEQALDRRLVIQWLLI